MPPVDFQVLFDISLGALGMLGGWVLRTLWAATNQLRLDISSLEKNLPTVYVRRDDFRDFATRIETLLEKIDQKLDRKVDRQ